MTNVCIDVQESMGAMRMMRNRQQGLRVSSKKSPRLRRLRREVDRERGQVLANSRPQMVRPMLQLILLRKRLWTMTSLMLTAH
jgi:hypothetical protein